MNRSRDNRHEINFDLLTEEEIQDLRQQGILEDCGDDLTPAEERRFRSYLEKMKAEGNLY